ncbi:Fe-S cluster assembly protein SufD [Marinospirillum minutulum]|uniref:Fe-S cluster assembly protein SufD n=1 Tax=Marinospirillum minutulum TaxID=64974 RepID=UPI0004055F22|nr:Fe-S cluster assembly protein SufD [Marinospirillum minutulum]
MKHYAQAFDAFNKNAEDGWLKSQRIAAFARFEHLGFPTPSVEYWKYTDTKALAKREFKLATGYDQQAAAELLKAKGLKLDAHRLVFVDGLLSSELSNLEGLQDAVVIEPLSQALATELELTSGMMGRLAGIDVDVFTALNFAFVSEGVVVRVGANQKVNKPLLVTYLSTATEEVMSHPRILIAAGASSELQLIEHFIGADEAKNFTNRVVEGVMERNAKIHHTLLQQPSDKEWWVGRIQIEQKRDSRYTSHQMNLGGKLVRDDLVCDLNGEGAECDFSGLLFGRNRQHLDIHTLVNHNAPLTNSYETYKTILNDRSQGVFNSKVIVKKDSQKIHAVQNNANLLLSDQAQINAKPELEIYADDVKCAHGATTGQLDMDALFYLMARGIGEEEARGLLTLAFANEVIDKLELPEIYNLVETTVAGQLPHKIELELTQ